MTTPGASGDWRGDGALPDDIVIPDDARDLELDRLALDRERAAARRRARWGRLLLTRRWRTHGLSGPLVAACLLIVFLFAALPALLTPRGGRVDNGPLPLATSTVPAGHVGSLLPAEQLTSLGSAASDMRSTDLRPAVVAVVPAACEATAATLSACGEAVGNITGSARSYGFNTYLVGGAADKTLLGMVREPGADAVAYPYHEADHLLLKAFPATTLPTAVFVDRRGLVQAVIPGVTGHLSVTGVLDQLAGVAT